MRVLVEEAEVALPQIDAVEEDTGVQARSEAPQAVRDALLHPPRLEALTACDQELAAYDPRSWRIVFRLRGRNMQSVLAPLVVEAAQRGRATGHYRISIAWEVLFKTAKLSMKHPPHPRG